MICAPQSMRRQGIILFFILFSCSEEVISQGLKANEDDGNAHCNTFVAPSAAFGYGVYAARDFVKGELVEITPLYLPLDSDGVEVQSSILFDYVHASGCGTVDEESDQYGKDQLLFGQGSSYNHNARPSVEFVEYGKGKGHIMAVQATRNISAGEELFARYGGNDWFEARNLRQQDTISSDSPEITSIIPEVDLPYYKSQYCSKTLAGIGYQSFTTKVLRITSRVDFVFDALRELPENDAGFGAVRAKVDLRVGDRIEISLGLLVSQRIMADTPLSSLLIRWQDLDSTQQRTLRTLRKNHRDRFVLHYPGGVDGERIDAFETYEDLAIVPLGALALVRRVGSSSSRGKTSMPPNCSLKIRPSLPIGSSSLSLELVAATNIPKGKVLLLDLEPSGTDEERSLLENELKKTGQPYHASTFATPSRTHDEL